ncbi:MAG: ubiquitin-like protein Pup, partial [Actinobacteria bacterium]|nr:ubiquitin-like protein Pup [Actinomycetota bacterium]
MRDAIRRRDTAVPHFRGTRSNSDLVSELDDLLNEIDEVLESNAEEFVKNYVQK